MKSNTIGFYAIRGKEPGGFLETSKVVNIAGFLEKIRAENKEYKTIVVALDNFSSHRSKVVKEKVEELLDISCLSSSILPKLKSHRGGCGRT